MKKIYALSFILFFGIKFLSAQCVIDTSELTSPGIYPPADSLPCIIKDSVYDQTLQIKVPASFDTTYFYQNITIVVHWVHILRLNGLPGGISWSMNPASDTLIGGQTGCLNLSGLDTSATGIYKLHPIADIYVHTPAIFLYPASDTVFRNFDLSKLGAPYNLYVANSSDSCRRGSTSGINDPTTELNPALSVYPNPNNGLFELKFNASNKITGQIVVTDMTGREVFTEPVEAQGFYNSTIDLKKSSKGVYILQFRSAEGFATRKILVE